MIAHWSKLFIPTLREAPAGPASEGAKLLARAGYRRGDASLMLGLRARQRMEAILRRELDALGGQEIQAADPTAMLDLARELRSYKQLPQIWYRLGPTLEVLSFDLAAEARERTFLAILRAFSDVFATCGIEGRPAEALDGLRLVIPCEAGEDLIGRAGAHLCDLDRAWTVATAPLSPDPEGDLAPEPFHTPNRKTIAELAEFTGLPETSHIKSLVMAADGALVMALLRGDHQLSEAKLAHVLDASKDFARSTEPATAALGGLPVESADRAGSLRARDVRPARAGEILQRFGANPGSLGPVGLSGIRILADESLRGRRNMIAGANRDDYHLRHVTPGEDFACEFFDLRQAAEGERTLEFGEVLRIEKAVTLGALQRRPANAGLHVTNEAGREAPLWLGSYFAAPDRLLWAIAEQHHDADGLSLPPPIAPFDLIVTPLDPSTEPQRQAVAAICDAAQQAGLDVLVDDRNERPGGKFKDNDLTGLPWRITIGKKLAQGLVEIFERRSKQKSEAAVDAAVEFIRTRR